MQYWNVGCSVMCESISVSIKVTGTGVYCLGFDGGEGKTYLWEVLNSKSMLNESILCITYNKERSEDSLIKMIDDFSGQVLFLDRLNLYYTEKVGKTLSKKNCVVLVDLKDNDYLRQMPTVLAEVEIREDVIEVREI